MNICSLKNLVIQSKIYLAMKRAICERVQNVLNRNGATCIKVIYLTGEAALKLINKFSGFMFLDKDGRDITAMVEKSFRN